MKKKNAKTPQRAQAVDLAAVRGGHNGTIIVENGVGGTGKANTGGTIISESGISGGG